MYAVLPEDRRAAFAEDFAVPRGTLERLDAYVALLTEWQTRFNLVGVSTLPQVWDRHIRDSAQLLALSSRGLTWLDIGAGGGFPGLVLAAMTDDRFHLVESVGKKAKFLTAAAEAMGVADRVVVHNARVEALPAFPVGVITARACAALPQLFDWGLRFSKASTLWVLPKGASVTAEIDLARKRFDFEADLVPSQTDGEARIVMAKGVRRR